MPNLAFWLDQIELTVFLIALVLLGALGHELGHLVLGQLFGGGTYFDQWTLIIPSRVNFRTPYEMTDWQVRVAGGWPYIFLLLLIAAAWHRLEYLLFFSAGGGLVISPSDLNAAHNPRLWKKMTAGETIHPKDYQDGE